MCVCACLLNVHCPHAVGRALRSLSQIIFLLVDGAMPRAGRFPPCLALAPALMLLNQLR